MKVKIIAAFITVVLLTGLLAGCGAAPTEPSYSDEMTENVLTALNAGDYAKFSQDFDEAMKGALPESSFASLKSQLASTIGDYVSREVDKVVTTDDYTTVVYTAEFTKKDKVTVTIAFHTVDGVTEVSGLWFK